MRCHRQITLSKHEIASSSRTSPAAFSPCTLLPAFAKLPSQRTTYISPSARSLSMCPGFELVMAQGVMLKCTDSEFEIHTSLHPSTSATLFRGPSNIRHSIPALICPSTILIRHPKAPQALSAPSQQHRIPLLPRWPTSTPQSTTAPQAEPPTLQPPTHLQHYLTPAWSPLPHNTLLSMVAGSVPSSSESGSSYTRNPSRTNTSR